MDKKLLEQIINDQQNIHLSFGIKRDSLEKIHNLLNTPHAIVISGIRRTGKSTLLYQILTEYYNSDVYYINFEDERLIDFQTEDFAKLYEVMIELVGIKKVFLVDEIQNVQNWEIFVRRLQDSGIKFFITGSNASLLSKELGTRLTGRNIRVELFPFSFAEYLRFKQVSIDSDSLLNTKKKMLIKRCFNEYLRNGGMPEYLKYNDHILLKHVYNDILYRDIVARYDLKEVKALRELSLYLISNVGKLISYNKLKSMLGLGSSNTVKDYIHYLEESYLLFTVNRFTYSLKQQAISNKKIYCIDNGIAEAVAFGFSENHGRYLENLVYITLRQQFEEIYYYNTENNLEVDFLLRQSGKIIGLIQVCYDLSNEETKKREIKALLKAMSELNLKEATILTDDEEDELEFDLDLKIKIIPVYKWLTR